MENSASLGGVMRAPTKEEELARMKEPLHAFRKEIDACIVKAESRDFIVHSSFREREQVIIKLKEAKMWVGKILESLGSELPKEFQDKAE